MLVFIDESGHPHPGDPTARPVLAAVCFPQQESRNISRQLFSIKRGVLGDERAGLELKAHSILNRRTFRRRQDLPELMEEIFERVRNLPITIFAVVMEKPETVVPRDDLRLPRQYRYILQRVNALLSDQTGTAVVLVDGDGSQYGGLSAKFERYLNRFREGQSMTKVVDTPYFVDSRYTMGIQLADIVAGVVRQYHENDLSRGLPSDPYLRAVVRYYRTIESKMQDLTSPDGFPLPSLYFMAERLHYFGFEEEASEAG